MAAKNPILTDAAVTARFAALPPDAKLALWEFARWLYRYAADQAELAWGKKKAPMAVYWSAVKAWAFHIARTVRRANQPAATPSPDAAGGEGA